MYLFPASVLKPFFLFEETTCVCRTLDEVTFQALQIHLKARGFLHFIVKLSLQLLRTWPEGRW